MGKLSTQLAVAILCFLLGILLVSQFRTQEKLAEEVRAQSPQNQLTLLGSLVESNAKLRDEVIKLETQLRDMQSADSPDVEAMREELNQLQIVNGHVPAKGPGVRLALDAPLENYWLNDLINELRNAGAEGVSLNGYRIRAWSAVQGGGDATMLDGAPLARPYVIEAIGDAEALFTALNRPGGLLLQLRAQYGAAATDVVRLDEVLLPSSSLDSEDFRYARPIP